MMSNFNNIGCVMQLRMGEASLEF